MLVHISELIIVALEYQSAPPLLIAKAQRPSPRSLLYELALPFPAPLSVTRELELDIIQPHMAQEPMLRGEVGARVRVIRACGQRRERRYGRARWCKAPG